MDDGTIPTVRLHRQVTHRLIATRYPTTGILDRVAEPEDLEAVFELEAWTNDRISNELGILRRMPRDEWVTGKPLATVVMAAFCHPRSGGARFTDGDRGAWYASFSLETAHAEALHHRGRELREVGVTDARLQMREYLATFSATLHDIRDDRPAFRAAHDPDDYGLSQRFAKELGRIGSDGIVYRSVRHPSGTCLVSFRPKLVAGVRVGHHFEYRWSRDAPAMISRL